MGALRYIFEICIDILQIEFVLGGYHLSLYGFLIFGMLAVILAFIIFSFFDI